MNHNFFKSFRIKIIDELVVLSNELTNNFAGLGSYMARGLPVGPRWFRLM
jgi:hypothetical protein